VWDFAPFDRRLRAPPGSVLERLTLPIAIRRSSALITISDAIRDELGKRYPAALSKALVTYPAADPRFSPQPGENDDLTLRTLGMRRPYVLVTGTVEPRKNLPRLIEAFAGLDENARGGRELVLAGSRGWGTQPTDSLVSAHRDCVRALGWVPEEKLPCLYRHAEVFCYVSLYEGFGIPVLEAMQSGTAVLTSSTSSMPEVGGDAASYVDPRDTRDIRRGLRELLSDPALRRRCEAAGIVRASSFSWDDTARRILSTLEGLRARGSDRASIAS
jgi:glycosyltransferase involved in cell wall biosynthesis